MLHEIVPPGVDATPLMKEYGAAVEQGFKGDILDYQKEIFSMKQRSPLVTVQNITGSSLGKLGEEQAKQVVTERPEAEKAVQALGNLSQIKGLMDKGIITGTGAQFITNVGNLLSSRFGFKQFEDPVANTQAYQAAMGRQVGEIIKQFGAGTGLSDADRDYAEKAAGGKISLTEQSLRKIITINEKAYKNVIKNYNEKASEIMNKPGSEGLLYDMRLNYEGNQQQNQNTPSPPVEGAQLNPRDGQWYVEKNGQWFRVEK